MILMILLAGAADAENPGETTAWFGMGMQPATSPASNRIRLRIKDSHLQPS
jgi:hypothetical protein